MAYLSINGVTIPCADGKASTSDLLVGGGDQQAYDGSTNTEFQRILGMWQLQTTPDTQANSKFYRQWLRGLGYHWSFDDSTLVSGIYNGQYSDGSQKLATVTSGSGGTTAIVGGAKYGTGCLQVFSGSAGVFGTAAFPVLVNAYGGTATTWTAWVWRNETGTWHWYWIPNSGNYYKDGVSQGAGPPAWFTTSTTTATITGSGAGGTSFLYDDLVIVPYAVPQSFEAGMYTFAQSNAWSNLPRLTASGDFLDTLDGAVSITCSAAITGNTVVQVATAGSWNDNAETVGFEIVQT